MKKKKNSKQDLLGNKLFLLLMSVFVFIAMSYQTYHYNLPKFKVGDCMQFQPSFLEKWETNTYYIEKVEEIGEKSYRVSWFADNQWFNNNSTISFSSDNFRKQVECPKEIK